MKPKKSLGQHFLNSPETVRKIIEIAELSLDDIVLEVGPGRGGLTKALLERAGKVIAVEKDRELKPFLENLFQEEIKKGTLELVFGDILQFTKEEPLYKGSSFVNCGKNYKIVANIPYYITGELLRLFLSGDFQPKSMTLLVQKEVAERIVARDGKESILSISVKAYGVPTYIQTVSARDFLPPPKVDSAILHIDAISKDFFTLPTWKPDVQVEEEFFKLVKTGFAHKRKLLIGNLKNPYKYKGSSFVVQALEKCSIPQNARAENVSLDGWKCLLRRIMTQEL
ncbi:MAG: ribosomal RNA small subunit methyltransferase A [Parcubacteria group bacterium]|nr:ribosomal RNA small subunit methyltransferase A [Parcubacteria group bacterium]